ncbi:cytochrome P450 [Streptomyces blastmyceticus]|uniref:Cytochrome P450 n=1 Tax=Streptomyces blastmyceticus TaxID=68180 RepID=A0ABN0X8A9_9ACTN
MIDPEIFGHNKQEFIEDPYPFYAQMRSNQPIFRSPRFDGAWMLFRHRDMIRLAIDPRLSSSRARLPAAKIPVPCRAEFEDMFTAFERWMAFKDGGCHRQRRRQAVWALAYLTEEHLTPLVREVAGQLRQQLKAEPAVDVMGSFAEPLPALVIAELLRAPASMAPVLKGWADDIADLYGSTDLRVEDIRRIQGSALHLLDYLRSLATTGDPASILAHIQAHSVDGYRPSQDQAIALCIQLMFAGMEPTRYLVGNAVRALNQHPGQLDLLRRQPNLMPGAVDEFLRYDTPVQFTARTAATSFTYEGHRISAGDPVLFYTASAHRDPEAWDRPDDLDITRSPNPHLGFGRGPHYCLGSTFARVVCQEALSVLLDEFPVLQLHRPQALDWNTNLGFRGYRSLYLTRGDPVMAAAP